MYHNNSLYHPEYLHLKIYSTITSPWKFWFCWCLSVCASLWATWLNNSLHILKNFRRWSLHQEGANRSWWRSKFRCRSRNFWKDLLTLWCRAVFYISAKKKLSCECQKSHSEGLCSLRIKFVFSLVSDTNCHSEMNGSILVK